jgi:hypothetical protein
VGQVGGFSVDPAVLSSARGRVGGLLREVEGLREGFVGASSLSSSVFGHDELAAAAEEFRERWGVGVRRLAAEASSIHRRLGETVDAYRRGDLEAARLFERLSREGR